MKDKKIEQLRSSSRKLIRELGMLELEPEDTQKTPGHWHALIEIEKKPGITISELGRILLMSTSTISRVIKFLAKNRSVKFQEGMDKREKSLFLTESGAKEIEKINQFSDSKIIGAFEYLTDADVDNIIKAIKKYEMALEKSREVRDAVKIVTLSTSRTIRKQIVKMVSEIQKKEFAIPITDDLNAGIIKAENEYYFNKSYNFWYAIDDEGKVLGSIGLKRIDDRYGEIKKMFVIPEYRGKGVASKLMNALLKAAAKHQFHELVLGTTDKFHAAHKFYAKYGFKQINKKELPKGFEFNPFDSLFYRIKLNKS